MSFTDFKEVSSNNSGSTTRYGGNDLKDIMQIFNNKTVATRRVSIKNPWRFTEYFDLAPAASGTPAAPTDANNSRMYADPSDFKLKIKKTGGAVVDVENLDIANSALQTITDKAKLHSQIYYKDQNNNIGSFYMDVGQISTPSNPSAGTRRVFVDQATGELSVRTTAGVTTSLETGAGGGGGGDVFLNQANTFGDFDSTFRSGRLDIRNPANTQSYSIVGSAIAAARNITLPLLTANDVMVTEAFAQTLTNKTIAAGSNTISGIADAHIASHTTTKITTTAKGQLNSAIVYNDQANTFTNLDQIFKSSRLLVRNPGDTFSYLIAGSAIAANRTVTLPLLTADDTAVTQAFAQTLTNKTINIDANTIKHSTTNAAGDLLESDGTAFIRLPRGTANQVLTVNAGGTDIAWATPSGGGGTAREDIAAYWQEVMNFAVSGTFGNMSFCYENNNSTINETLDAAVMNIDFTGATQYRAQFAIRRASGVAAAGTTGADVRVVDSTNSSNVLFSVTGITSDTRQTSGLSALPAWATGAKTVVPQSRLASGTGTPLHWVGGLTIWLK